MPNHVVAKQHVLTPRLYPNAGIRSGLRSIIVKSNEKFGQILERQLCFARVAAHLLVAPVHSLWQRLHFMGNKMLACVLQCKCVVSVMHVWQWRGQQAGQAMLGRRGRE